MTTTSRAIRDIAVRTIILLGFDLGFRALLARYDDSQDALGAGLLAFLIIVLISGIGGLIDGWRLTFGRMAFIWLVTAVLAAVGMTALINVFYEPFDLDVFFSDLRDLGAFTVGLILVPALLGGGLTALVTSRRDKRPG